LGKDLDLLKDLIRPLARTNLGKTIRSYVEPVIRDVLDLEPAWYREPEAWHHAVSDSFFWRNDAQVKTRFDLMNMPSFVWASPEVEDRALMVFFSALGQEIHRERFELQPFEIRPVFIDEYLDADAGCGTFCVFHDVAAGDWPFEYCLSDRGYTSYKSNRDILWSYVHGCCNTLVMAHDPGSEHYYTLSLESTKLRSYRPQLNLADCSRFEALVSNPLETDCSIIIKTLDGEGHHLEEFACNLPGLGCGIVEVDNALGEVERIEVRSRLFLCRPLIFKYYSSHFDVLHS
jgi:hypothetical protein